MNLAAILGLFLPSPLAPVVARTRPNPYAPDVGRSQVEVALRQAASPGAVAGIRGGLSGMSGSEADYAEGQVPADELVQDISAHALPPAMFHANVGEPPSIYAFDRGPAGLARTRWGVEQRGRPFVIASTLLPPGQRTPTPREMAGGYAASRPGRLRLDDIFTEADT